VAHAIDPSPGTGDGIAAFIGVAVNKEPAAKRFRGGLFESAMRATYALPPIPSAVLGRVRVPHPRG